MPLHLSDANRFNNGNQVAGCQAFDQFGCVVASMRKPGKQGPCRLLWRHAVSFFKEYFADALMVHGNLGKVVESDSFQQIRKRGVTETTFDPRAMASRDQSIRAYTSVAGTPTTRSGPNTVQAVAGRRESGLLCLFCLLQGAQHRAGTRGISQAAKGCQVWRGRGWSRTGAFRPRLA